MYFIRMLNVPMTMIISFITVTLGGLHFNIIYINMGYSLVQPNWTPQPSAQRNDCLKSGSPPTSSTSLGGPIWLHPAESQIYLDNVDIT